MHIIVMRQFEHNFCSQVGPCTRVPYTRYLGTLISVSVSSLFLSLPRAWIDPYFLCPAIFVVFTTDSFYSIFYFIAVVVACREVVSLIFVLMSVFFFFFFFSKRKKENGIFCNGLRSRERYLSFVIANFMFIIFFNIMIMIWGCSVTIICCQNFLLVYKEKLLNSNQARIK